MPSSSIMEGDINKLLGIMADDRFEEAADVYVDEAAEVEELMLSF